MLRKQETKEERNVLTAMDLMEVLILDQLQVKLKENKDAGSITEVAVSKEPNSCAL